jgi:hypothetical protein
MLRKERQEVNKKKCIKPQQRCVTFNLEAEIGSACNYSHFPNKFVSYGPCRYGAVAFFCLSRGTIVRHTFISIAELFPISSCGKVRTAPSYFNYAHRKPSNLRSKMYRK